MESQLNRPCPRTINSRNVVLTLTLLCICMLTPLQQLTLKTLWKKLSLADKSRSYGENLCCRKEGPPSSSTHRWTDQHRPWPHCFQSSSAAKAYYVAWLSERVKMNVTPDRNNQSTEGTINELYYVHLNSRCFQYWSWGITLLFHGKTTTCTQLTMHTMLTGMK